MANKTSKKSQTQTKSKKSTQKNKKKSGWQKVLAGILVVLALIWYFGGKPTVDMPDGQIAIELTEEPIVLHIVRFVKGEESSEELAAAFSQGKTEKETVAAAESKGTDLSEETSSTTEKAAEKTVQTTASTAENKTAGGQTSVKSTTGTSGSSKADSGYSENNPLFFGNPTDALKETSSNKNYLMEKKQYTACYNTETLQPNWVAWHLGKEDIGSADRSDDFRPDTDLPSGWYEITKADYQYNAYGFDRGHVCPSADRTATQEDNSMTFLMTNMVPQSPDNNRVIWMHFETYERELVSEGNEVYIIAGPYGTGGTSSKGTFDEITITKKSGETLHMNVPAYTWKVCLVIPEGTKDLSRITKDTTAIAINVPNKMGMGKTGDWEQFITTIDDIEALTGYDFFELLPDDVEDALEAKTYSH